MCDLVADWRKWSNRSPTPKATAPKHLSERSRTFKRRSQSDVNRPQPARRDSRRSSRRSRTAESLVFRTTQRCLTALGNGRSAVLWAEMACGNTGIQRHRRRRLLVMRRRYPIRFGLEGSRLEGGLSPAAACGRSCRDKSHRALIHDSRRAKSHNTGLPIQAPSSIELNPSGSPEVPSRHDLLRRPVRPQRGSAEERDHSRRTIERVCLSHRTRIRARLLEWA